MRVFVDKYSYKDIFDNKYICVDDYKDVATIVELLLKNDYTVVVKQEDAHYIISYVYSDPAFGERVVVEIDESDYEDIEEREAEEA